MATGTKRLPRAVREQQMLDAAIEVFAVSGFHETSMDAIAAAANISKPMLYLYYGSKDELFGAAISRESQRFIDAMRVPDPALAEASNGKMSAGDLLRSTIATFLRFVDEHRNSWIMLYRQASNHASFAHLARESRDSAIGLVSSALQHSARHAPPGTNFRLYAIALVGSGEAIADRVASGDIDIDEASTIMTSFIWSGLKGESSSGG